MHPLVSILTHGLSSHFHLCSVCEMEKRVDESGSTHQRIVTQVGIVPLGSVGTETAYQCILLIAARPQSTANTYITESLDTYYVDFNDGQGFAGAEYPPGAHPKG